MTAAARVIVKIQELLVLIMSSHFFGGSDCLCNLAISDDFPEPAPDAIAAKTSPFRSVPRGPETLNEDMSSSNSARRRLTDGPNL